MWFGYWIYCTLSSSLSYVVTERLTLLSTIENIDNNLLDLREHVPIKILLFGSNSFDIHANTKILNATIEYILSTKRFDEPLFQWKQKLSNKVMNKQFLYLLQLLLVLFVNFYFSFLRICFIPGYPYNFRYLVIVSFNFTVYDIIYIYIYIICLSLILKQSLIWRFNLIFLLY